MTLNKAVSSWLQAYGLNMWGFRLDSISMAVYSLWRSFGRQCGL